MQLQMTLTAQTVADRFTAWRATQANPANISVQCDPEHPDFWSYENRTILSQLGIFSTDRVGHRQRRANEANAKRELELAYAVFDENRDHEHGKIAAAMETSLTSGIWARSTGEYARRCHELDRLTWARAFDPTLPRWERQEAVWPEQQIVVVLTD